MNQETISPSRRFMRTIAHATIRHAPALAMPLARRFADAAFRRQTPLHDETLAGLAAAFPEKDDRELQHILRAYAHQRYTYHCEQTQLDFMTPPQLAAYCRERVTIRGEDNLADALRRPEPILGFTPHYGNFAITTLHIAQRVSRERSVSMFFNPPEKNAYAPRMKRLIENLDVNAQPLYNDRSGLLKAFRALHKGGFVGIMPDVYDYEAGTIFVPFFGRLAFAMTGTAFLALKYDATVLPMYCHRIARGRFELVIDPPITLHRSGQMEEDIYWTTAAVFRNVEAHLRERPEQWMYWDTFLRRVYPRVELPNGGPSWRSGVDALSQRFSSASPVGAFVRELAARVRTMPLMEGTAE
jgi:KDO2-lipid IV(A) lauroyltransferase